MSLIDLTRKTTVNNLSVSPCGYGNDLINWSNHSTKVSFDYHSGGGWTMSASLRIYWGYLDDLDLADYNRNELANRAKFGPV
jgi:hypothetical protein